MITRRYDFICSRLRCYYHNSGKRHTCTDCAVEYIVAVREHCQWDHSILMLDLDLKIKEVA